MLCLCKEESEHLVRLNIVVNDNSTRKVEKSYDSNTKFQEVVADCVQNPETASVTAVFADRNMPLDGATIYLNVQNDGEGVVGPHLVENCRPKDDQLFC